MSVKIMSSVFERSKTTGNARLVLLALADACGDQGDCWPSVRSIAKKANVSPIIARKYINALVDVGVLIKEHSGDMSGRQTSNTYTIIEEKIGDDFISKEQLHLAMSPSRVKTKDMVTRVNTPDGNPCYQGEVVTGVNRAYMNHQKEPKKEPSYGFVADAPKTISDDLFPNNSQTDSAVIAERSPMDSRPKAAIPNKLAAFQTRANVLLGRRPATKWAANEIKAAANWLDTTDEEWELLEGYYANRGQDGYFCRKTMITLLNNWSSEIDKARSNQPVKPKQTCPDEKEDPEGFNAFWASVKPND